MATARDGREALALLGRDAAIALVVTDLEMPELDGIGLTRAIRARPRVVTAGRHRHIAGRRRDRRRGSRRAQTPTWCKQSFDQQALLATVERLVGR